MITMMMMMMGFISSQCSVAVSSSNKSVHVDSDGVADSALTQRAPAHEAGTSLATDHVTTRHKHNANVSLNTYSTHFRCP